MINLLSSVTKKQKAVPSSVKIISSKHDHDPGRTSDKYHLKLSNEYQHFRA